MPLFEAEGGSTTNVGVINECGSVVKLLKGEDGRVLWGWELLMRSSFSQAQA
jgi:hypothetical protein